MPSVDDERIAELERRLAAVSRELEQARTEAASGRFFHKLVEASDDVISVVGADGVVRFTSSANERMMGMRREDFVGMNVLDEIHPDDREYVVSKMREVFAGPPDRPVSGEFRRRHADGRWVHMQTTAKNLTADPDVGGLVAVGRDITDAVHVRDQLRDAERMFRALFERTSVAVTIRDVDTQSFIDCNPAALRLYGFESREELLHSTPDDLAPPIQPDGRVTKDVLRDYVARALRDGVAQMEWLARRRDGETFPVEVRTTVIALEDGRRLMQTMIEDVTHRRRTEDFLRDRARRDALVSRVSRRFVERPTDEALASALEELGKFLGAARVRARRFSADGASLDTIAEWHALGAPPYPPALRSQDAASDLVRWVAGEIARRGFLKVNDTETLPSEIRALTPPVPGAALRALLVVPMSFRGVVSGWVVADSVDLVRAWTEDDVATMRLVAEMIAVSRARAEAEDDLRRRAARDELLSDVSRRLLHGAPGSAIDATLERVGAAFGAVRVSLYGVDERAHRLRCTDRWSAPSATPGEETLDVAAVPEGMLVAVDAPVKGDAAGLARAERWVEELRRASGPRVVHALVGYGGRVFGLLTARCREQSAWTEGDLATLRAIGELIAIHRVRSAAESALAAAKEDAVAASLTKSAFLANMSHELRTPLNGVIGMVDLLRTTRLDARQQHYAEIARASANLLLSVISDILDFSKIEAGKLELEAAELDVHEIVEEVASILALSAEAKRLELSCESHLALAAPLVGDAPRLRQVLVNLVNNAVKFTREGEVAVRATLVAESANDARVRVEVRDTGVGIPLEAQEKLFRPFSQVDASATREHGGTGLGLAICRELVERMGGTIGVASVPGVGSTFWFEVTLAKGRGAPVLEPDPTLAGLRVLGVDDNGTNREVLRAQLRAAGMWCDVVTSGAEALAMLAGAARTRPYAIALLDHHMPGMDGHELARRITADPLLRATRLVMLGSVASPLGPAEQRELGIVGYCTKPIWRRQLLHVLRGVVAGSDAGAWRDRDAPVEAAAARAHVLLVEDSPVNAEVAGEILRAAGYSFDLAEDGAAAVRAVSARAYDVVLMDCQLPEVDGFEATRRIRGLERAGSLLLRATPLPIVALTASATKGDVERCLEAGMTDHVSKPVDAKRLLAVVAHHTGGPVSQVPGPSSDDAPRVADLSRALERLRGDRALLGRIAAQFAEGAPEARSKLRSAVEAKDVAAVAFAAHRLRGQASSFDAGTVVAATEALETAAKRAAWSAAEGELAHLEVELDRLLGVLEKRAP